MGTAFLVGSGNLELGADDDDDDDDDDADPTGEIAQHGVLHGHARVHKEDLKRIFCQKSVHNLYPNKTSPWNTHAIPSNNSMLGCWMVYQIEGHLPWRRCNGPVMSFETMDGESEPLRLNGL